MSTEIEREVVSMVWDAKQFQRGVKGTMQDVEQLKKSFDFTRAQQSMSEVAKMGSKDYFGPMSRSLDAINSKISLLGVASAVVVSRLTNAVIDGSKKLFNTLITAPIKTGLEEYETQLNAVQTILANTKKDGTTLEYVNEKLDELNLYADRTIYNFTQMTDSIGKFTAAGVDIDTSTASIKGLANVAALSGSNAQQASTAMYQLSQAMASGTVRLQDWMSIENAGMGGAVFQEALKDTARVHGIAIDQMIEKNGSFRLSLQEGWLTSDFMAETLSKFTGDMTDAQLESLGYNKEQIAAIQEMAVAANDAATKIKTLTQLKDTMAEALQSGWGQTWRIVFGDFEQAKELWGGIAEVFGGIIDQSSTARNTMLEMWAEVGGRRALIDGFMNVLQAVINILSAFGEAIRAVFAPLDYVDLFQISFAFFNFSKALLEGTKNLDPFKRIVQALATVLQIVIDVVTKVVSEFRLLIGGVDLGGSKILDFVLRVADAIIAFYAWADSTDAIDMAIESVFWKIGRFFNRVKELTKEFTKLEVIQDISKWIGKLDSKSFANAWDAVLVVMRAVATPIVAVALALKELYTWFVKMAGVEDFGERFKNVKYAEVKTGFKDIADSIRELFDSVKNNEVLKKFGEFFATFDGRRFNAFIDNAKDTIKGFTDILGKFNRESEQTPKNVEATTDAVAKGSDEMQKAIIAGLDKMIAQAGTLDYSKIFEALNTGIFAALVLSIRKFANMDVLGDAVGASIFGADSPIARSITGTMRAVEGTMKSMQANVKADTLKKIAVAIALLAASIALLSFIDSVRLAAATGAIAAMVGALFLGSKGLSQINPQEAAKAAIAIAGMAIAMLFVAGALRAIQGIDSNEIETTIGIMAASLATLVISINALGGKTNSANTLKAVTMLFALSTALYLMYGVIRLFGNLDPEVLSQGILGLTASIGVLTVGLAALTRLGGKDMILAATAIVEMAGALIILAQVITIFGNMDLDKMSQGLKAVGAAMLGYAVTTRLMGKAGLVQAGLGLIFMAQGLKVMADVIAEFGAMEWEEIQKGLAALAGVLLVVSLAGRALIGTLPAAAAMALMSVAILGFAAAIKVLSTISWGELAVALAGVVGIFVILGLAGLALAPIAPILLIVGAAMLLIGVAAAAIGLGVSLAAAGLVALAGSAAAIAAAITLVGSAIIEILPRLAEAFATALVGFLQVIAENQPALIEALKSIFLGMITAIWGLIPDIVAVVMDMITALLTAIAERLPDMIQRGYDILLAFLEGIEDNIADVIAAGLGIVTEIINGIAEGLPALIDSAFNLILTFLNGMADAIELYMPQIIEAGTRIGVALIDGIVTGLANSVERVYDWLKGLANKAIQKLKEHWGIASPAKATIEIARYLGEGLVVGLRDITPSVLLAMTEFAEKAQSGISSLQDALVLGLDEVVNFDPVIKPVLDLSDIRSGARGLNNMFTGSAILGRLATDHSSGGILVGAQGSQESLGGVKQVQYIQNNYSPKALDRAAIYRQTKTHVARLAFQE